MVLLQFQLQQRLELVRLDVAADHQAQAVGDEVDQVVVGLHLGVVGEQGALGRAFDMVFQCHEAFAARLVEQFIEQAEDIDVILLLVARALNTPTMACRVCLTVLAGVPTRNAPSAAPPMMTSS